MAGMVEDDIVVVAAIVEEDDREIPCESLSALLRYSQPLKSQRPLLWFSFSQPLSDLNFTRQLQSPAMAGSSSVGDLRERLTFDKLAEKWLEWYIKMILQVGREIDDVRIADITEVVVAYGKMVVYVLAKLCGAVAIIMATLMMLAASTFSKSKQEEKVEEKEESYITEVVVAYGKMVVYVLAKLCGAVAIIMATLMMLAASTFSKSKQEEKVEEKEESCHISHCYC
ncbi:hypothetical protein PIB30_096464, partial [Stylosanthes scabra]|nr:hypothetical protein [Stylosanthes scabra]